MPTQPPPDNDRPALKIHLPEAGDSPESSTDAASTDAASTDAASTDAASTDAASSEVIPGDATPRDTSSSQAVSERVCERLDVPASRPRFGPITGLLIVAWMIFTLISGQQIAAKQTSFAVWLGLTWSGQATATWLLLGNPLRPRSAGMLLLVLLLHAGLRWHQLEQPLTRYLISLSAVMLCQVLLTPLLGVPPWRFGGRQPTVSRPRPHRQFGILAIMLITIMVAVFAAAARRYEVPDPLHYVGVSAVSVILAGLATGAQAICFKPRPAPWLLAGLVTWGYAGYQFLAFWTQFRNETYYLAATPENQLIAVALATFTLTQIAVGVTGRLDALTPRH